MGVKLDHGKHRLPPPPVRLTPRGRVAAAVAVVLAALFLLRVFVEFLAMAQ